MYLRLLGKVVSWFLPKTMGSYELSAFLFPLLEPVRFDDAYLQWGPGDGPEEEVDPDIVEIQPVISQPYQEIKMLH